MIGFEPGFEARVVADDVRFNIPDYLLQAALDASYAAKDHTHTADQISGLEGALGSYLTKTDAANTYQTRLSGAAGSDDVSDTDRFIWRKTSDNSILTTSWYAIKAKLKAVFDDLYVTLSGNSSVNGTISASLTHRDNGGYFNLGSYGTATYGSGYGRIWYNADGNTVTFQSGNTGVRSQLTAGAADFSDTVVGKAADAYRIQNSGKAVIMRKDGSTFYFLVSDTETGTWNALRPFYFNLTSGAVSMNNGASIGGTLTVSGNMQSTGGSVYAGSAYLQNNGNIVGSIWNNIGAGDAYTAVVNRIESRCQAWAVQESNRKARKATTWGQWNFTSHDQRAQNGTGENIYYTAKLTGTYSDTVQLQISPDNNTYWTVATTREGDASKGEFSGGCLPPGWWMRLIRGSGNYNANVILVY